MVANDLKDDEFEGDQLVD